MKQFMQSAMIVLVIETCSCGAQFAVEAIVVLPEYIELWRKNHNCPLREKQTALPAQDEAYLPEWAKGKD